METERETEAREKAPKTWEMLAKLAAAGDAKALEAYVDGIGPSEAFRAILRLDPEEREKVLTTLSPEDAADLIEEIPDEHASDLIERLPAKQAASILSEMDVDDQVDVIGDMHDDDAEAILAEMTPEDAAHIRRLIRYDPEVAGGLMSTDYLAYRESVLVGDVIDDLSKRADEREEPEHDAHVYAVSRSGKLIGVLDLRDLVLARRSTPLAAILKSSLFVRAEAPLDELEAFFDRYDFQAVPVVDERQGLVGVVGRDEVAEAIANRSQEEYAKSKGIIGGDEIRSLPVLTRARRRLSWLSLNIVLNIMAASVIAMYFDTLSAAIALAVFLPIVSDMSGCSGNQAVAVSMRELSLGIVKPYEVLRVWIQEIKVGVLNGITLGILLGVVAWLWKDNYWLGLVVGSALAINTMVAVSLGGTVPLVLKRFGVDPAVASGPILTTVTDMCGFFLVLSLATLVLPQLAGV
ncbi:MAG: magnesium transporter [Burkholderiaceae bacterium]|nr:magnesium transporter [Sulfuritalea sp.]MCF8175240.1 magnesium transporter [Burkholderiaceae bacterium]MCF8184470.1 magnesium transporter [Polynucleobacter sp.]